MNGARCGAPGPARAVVPRPPAHARQRGHPYDVSLAAATHASSRRGSRSPRATRAAARVARDGDFLTGGDGGEPRPHGRAADARNRRGRARPGDGAPGRLAHRPRHGVPTPVADLARVAPTFPSSPLPAGMTDPTERSTATRRPLARERGRAHGRRPRARAPARPGRAAWTPARSPPSRSRSPPTGWTTRRSPYPTAANGRSRSMSATSAAATWRSGRGRSRRSALAELGVFEVAGGAEAARP